MSDQPNKMHGVPVSEAEVAAGLGFSGVDEFRAWNEFSHANPNHHSCSDVFHILTELNAWDGSIEDAVDSSTARDIAFAALDGKPVFPPDVYRNVRDIRSRRPRQSQHENILSWPMWTLWMEKIHPAYQPRPEDRPDLWVMTVSFQTLVPNLTGYLEIEVHNKKYWVHLHPIPDLERDGVLASPWDDVPVLRLQYRKGVDVGQIPIESYDLQTLLIHMQPLKVFFSTSKQQSKP